MYHCQFCGEYFLKRKPLDAHINKLHKSQLVLAHVCNICGEKFGWYGDLMSHYTSVHYPNPKVDPVAQCEICGKLVKKCNLKVHVRVHSTEKPFACDICGATSRSQNLFNSHLRTHTGEKKYECHVCQKKFTQWGHLNTHRKAVHSKDKPWPCSICGKSFSLRDAMTNHLRTHTEEQPYRCTLCGRRFKSSTAMKVHLRVHTKEKPFSCQDCGKTFSHKVSLVKYHRCPNAKVMNAEPEEAAIASENV